MSDLDEPADACVVARVRREKKSCVLVCIRNQLSGCGPLLTFWHEYVSLH